MERAKAQLIARTEPSRAFGLSSAQLAKFNFWKSSAQLNSPNWTCQFSSAQLSSPNWTCQLSSFYELKNEPRQSARLAHLIIDFGEFTTEKCLWNRLFGASIGCLNYMKQALIKLENYTFKCHHITFQKLIASHNFAYQATSSTMSNLQYIICWWEMNKCNCYSAV